METLNPPVTARPRLWNRNFLLLWQGQLVSSLGDTVYAIALGFWILAVTGSTALMGTLMAASTLPRVLVGLLAGVVVDRSDRKWMLIAMDLIRGVLIVGIGLAAYRGWIQIWMVFAAGVVLSACSAFFFPAVSSSIPDIVPKEKVVQANSAFSLIYTGSGIVGNSAGGFFYQALGAPLMFLLNGISYVISAAAILLIRIPAIPRPALPQSFGLDFRSGLAFLWRVRGLRVSVGLFSVLNFFSVMGIMLLLPLFQKTPALGPGLYGLLMAGITGGMFGGFLLTSFLTVKPARRFLVFYLCGVAGMAAFAILPLVASFPLMLGLGFFFGVTSAVVNALINGVVQITVPPEMRGKVFSLLGTVSGGLMPIAFALGGVLGEVIPLRIMIALCFGITWLVFLPLPLSPTVVRYYSFDPARDRLEATRQESA